MAAIGTSIGVETTGLEAINMDVALTTVVALGIKTGLVVGQMFAADAAVNVQENCADQNFHIVHQEVAVVERILAIETVMVVVMGHLSDYLEKVDYLAVYSVVESLCNRFEYCHVRRKSYHHDRA
ncbi:uncharacterized protein Bfra_012190 [Botrytis fragariae]|uniref:Uncharacterized protein n=1 Tax=Botrytis fragariae TaxID=1964551 RepID=A0A8H6EDQ7_9HELO|nr:uncharacterized protein Bfra_012190 [Botrytis fragariae]KAF5868544.1 hypothetical protein Bfra_012190 [Botrytis fragariae]